MAETIFAGSDIEKLAARQASGKLGFTLAIFARLAKNFLVGDGPGNAGHGYGQDHEPSELVTERHRDAGWMPGAADASSDDRN